MKIDSPVSVDLSFDHRLRRVAPQKIIWNNREYMVTKVGLHHTYRTGRTLFHVFSVVSGNVFFRLVLNTDNLFWQLEAVEDGV